MRNYRVYLAALLLLLSACKSKSPEPAESPVAPSPSTTAGSDPSTRSADGADESDESAAAAGTSAGQEALDEAALYERHMVATLRQVLSQRHLRQLKMDDQVSSQAFDVFIKRLDPAKLYLLKSHVDELEAYRGTIDDQVKSGELTLGHAAAALLAKRVVHVDGVVQKLLSKPLNLSDDETMETDEEKRAFATSDAELEDRWRQVLELRTLYRMERMRTVDVKGAPDKGALKDATDELQEGDKPLEPLSSAALQERARKKLSESYKARFKRLRQRDESDAIERLLNAVLAVYDPHTLWMPPRRKEDFDIRMSGTLEGIGAVLQEDEHLIKVVRIVPGSASWRQGDLKAGDYIVGVAEAEAEPTDLVDMRLRDAVRLIRGPKGTEVRLTVKKTDGETVIIPIVRDVVRIEAAYAKGAVLTRKGSKAKVGYIDLASFYGDTRFGRAQTSRTCSTDVERLLTKLEAKGVDAVVLDLRGNGGGLLNEANAIAGLFLDKGPVVQTKDWEGEVSALRDPSTGAVWTGRLLVLVDRFSASASEIVAGALQDYRRAVIVGAPSTHGKGTVQSLVSLDRAADSEVRKLGLPSLGALKLTQQQYYRVTGASVQLNGVTPDVVLPDSAGYFESGERHHDFPIPADEIKPAAHGKLAPHPLERLQTGSQARVAKSEYFKTLTARVKLLKKRNDESRMPLSAAAFEAQERAEEAELEALKLDTETQRFSVRPVRYADAPETEESKASEKEWVEVLGTDAYVEEALLILSQMTER